MGNSHLTLQYFLNLKISKSKKYFPAKLINLLMKPQKLLSQVFCIYQEV